MFKEIVSALFPNTCIGCDDIIDEDEFLCDYCYSMIERYELNKFCTKCGNPKKQCNCKNNIFYFDGCVAPFKNNGIAKRVIYSFKFRHRESLADYLAEQMALTVKQCYYDTKFDAVCCLPIERLKGMRRGYNQTRILAEKVAKLLNLPFYDNILGFRKRKKLQHRIPFNERFKNIKDVYYVKTPLKNKTVLLVDDIKTTGATLSECAKELLAAGSNRVYCVTGLITERKDKKNGN